MHYRNSQLTYLLTYNRHCTKFTWHLVLRMSTIYWCIFIEWLHGYLGLTMHGDDRQTWTARNTPQRVHAHLLACLPLQPQPRLDLEGHVTARHQNITQQPATPTSRAEAINHRQSITHQSVNQLTQDCLTCYINLVWKCHSLERSTEMQSVNTRWNVYIQHIHSRKDQPVGNFYRQ